MNGTTTSIFHSIAVRFTVYNCIVLVTDPAFPLHIIDFLFQSRNADAEVVQLVGKLVVDHSFVSCGNAALCHSACNHLSHLITSDFLVATVCAVAIAFDNAVGSELSNCVVRPMVGRNILERVRRSKRRRGRANDESRRQSGNE